jgi:hypothetical protein
MQPHWAKQPANTEFGKTPENASYHRHIFTRISTPNEAIVNSIAKLRRRSDSLRHRDQHDAPSEGACFCFVVKRKNLGERPGDLMYPLIFRRCRRPQRRFDFDLEVPDSVR